MQKLKALLFVLVGLAIGCSPHQPQAQPEWNGSIQQWGTLKEVMHGQVVQGQVRLSDATQDQHLFGIGASDGLRGEILVSDSVAWVAKASVDGNIETHQNESPEDSAVFLALAQVPHWTSIPVESDVPASEFDEYLLRLIVSAGLEKFEDVPFVIDGEFSELKLHVLNGQCPFGNEDSFSEGSTPPLRKELESATGQLVGFFSENGAGRITHHGSRTHTHVMAGEDSSRVVGHVDSVSLAAGAVVRLPKVASKSAK